MGRDPICDRGSAGRPQTFRAAAVAAPPSSSLAACVVAGGGCLSSAHRSVPHTSSSSSQQGSASTLTRGEVRGGGKKPYKQKGTGNARRGSNVSPLFPGGGVSFGPKVRCSPVIKVATVGVWFGSRGYGSRGWGSRGWGSRGWGSVVLRLSIWGTAVVRIATLAGSPTFLADALRRPLLPTIMTRPQPKDWSIKMNKKERRLALATALQSAAGDVVVVESISSDGKVRLCTSGGGAGSRVKPLIAKQHRRVCVHQNSRRRRGHCQIRTTANPKPPPNKQTKSLLQALEKVGAPADKKVLLVVSTADELLLRAGRNAEKLSINSASALKVFDVLNADVLVFEKAALQKVKELYAPTAEASA